MTIERVSARSWSRLRIGTGNWGSRLHQSPDADGCRLLELEMGVHVEAVPAGSYTFMATMNGATPGTTVRRRQTVQIAAHTQQDIDGFYNDFQAAIYNAWRDRLWLVHSGGSGVGHGQAQHYENLKCGLRMFQTTQDRAQLRILLLVNPTVPGGGPTRWRSNCIRGGRAWRGIRGNPVDMKLSTADTGNVSRTRSSTDGDQTIEQCVAAHEFGHYIGLRHACAASGGQNSSAQYCIGSTPHRMRDIMAIGNDVRERHATPWLDRLPEHEYYPGARLTWTARREAPPPPAQSSGPQRGPTMGMRSRPQPSP